MKDEIDLGKYVGLIVKYWIMISVITVFFIFLAFIYNKNQPPRYIASTNLFVRSSGNSGMSAMQGMAGFAGFGLSVGGSSVDDLVSISKSKIVAKKVFDVFNAKENWNYSIKKSELSSSLIRGMITRTEKSGSQIFIDVSGSDPDFVVDVANVFAESLYSFWNELNITETRKKRSYIEIQLPIAKRDFNLAEKRYRDINMLENSSVTNFGANSGGLEVDESLSELKIKSAIYEMLAREYASIKLDESKDLMPFSVIDRAEDSSQIVRKNTMLLGLFGGVSVGLFFAIILENRKKSDK